VDPLNGIYFDPVTRVDNPPEVSLNGIYFDPVTRVDNPPEVLIDRLINSRKVPKKSLNPF
jgi:hypothetical protein